MDSTFQKIPFLRITLAFAVGIALNRYYEINTGISVSSALVVFIVLVALNRKYTIRTEPFFGTCVPLLFILLGSAVHSHYNVQNLNPHQEYWLATVLESPQEKANSYKSLLEIRAVESNKAFIASSEKVLVYFEKSDEVKDLLPGTQVLIKGSPAEIKNFGSPNSFNYKAYLSNKRIHRQVFLSTSNWKTTNLQSKRLEIRAELLREKLLNIYRSQNLGKNETEILSALTLGYKRELAPETKRIFSAAGAMHILAVSGLHVGILFLVFSFLFSFLKKHLTGKIIFVVSSIALLWSYAFITGLSPSVLRASTMFSILIIGDNLQRKANIYNSLAASAMLLLLLNPNNLFEVGFQLSYSAVFGIVFLQPRIAKLWPVENKTIKFFWDLFCVSLAAQIATFPLSAYYFNQFPVYFWLTNLFVIPAAMVLIPLGITLLLFAKIPVLAGVISFLLNYLIKTIYIVLQRIENLPFATLNFTLSAIELTFLLSFLFYGFIFLKNKRANPLKYSLASVLLLFLSVLTANYQQQKSSELIIFNNSQNLTIQLICGKKSYVVSEQTIEPGDFLFRQINDIKRKKRLTNTVFLNTYTSFKDEFLFLHKGILCFNSKTIFMDNERRIRLPDYSPDYLITTHKSGFDPNETNASARIISTEYLHTVPATQHIHSLKSAGAFCASWKNQKPLFW